MQITRARVRQVFADEIIEVSRLEPYLSHETAWDRFVARIISTGVVRVDRDVADLYRWVFGESHTEHFRVIYALSPDALRSTVREVD